MYAVIAVTINRSFAPVGKSAGQWAGSEGWFVFNQSNQALVTNSGARGAVCHWYHVQLFHCSVSPVLYLKKEEKKGVMSRLKKPPIHG